MKQLRSLTSKKQSRQKTSNKRGSSASAALGLALREVTVSWRNTPLFAPLTLDIAPGAIASLMGSSGAGKSTLLAAILGTLDSSFHISGKILLNAREVAEVAPHMRGIGLLFQDDLLFPHMTVAENLAFALPHGLPKADKKRQVVQALEQVEMPDLGDRKPFAISGGQRMRVTLMRTLLAQPKALLLDEPFSKLDQDLRARIRTWVFAHIRERAIPALMVSHDLADAKAADPDRIYHLTSQNQPKKVRRTTARGHSG